MSGVGKTWLSQLLRSSGDWFHYSIDYRIGTRYMDEAIVDNVKQEAMKIPFLRDLLLSDSIYLKANLTFENLDPLSTYLGKPGSAQKGGVPFDEYIRRQRQHHIAETRALIDTQSFIEKSFHIYGYPHFVCDTGGSICEVVDPDDPKDPVLNALSDCCTLVYMRENDNHKKILTQRFDASPKPLYYNEDFLTSTWQDYLDEKNIEPNQVDPDHFMRWSFEKLMAWRAPKYLAIGQKWGMVIDATLFSSIENTDQFIDLIHSAADMR